MSKTFKTALGIALILGAFAAAAQAQLIAGNNASLSAAGPITTWDFLGPQPNNRTGLFLPQGVTVPNSPNGRGLAIGGNPFGAEVYYTELVGNDTGGHPGFGPTDFIRVAAFNQGAGDPTDVRQLPNPRPDAGIQDLTFHNGTLHALTGYPDKAPVVYRLAFTDGAQIGSPIALTGNGTIPLQAANDADGFAVLPNGNFLVNNGDTSCIYNEYDKTTGQLVLTGTRNIPAFVCTGVDTDGTSLFFLTEFNSITQTDFDGNMIGFNSIQNEEEYQTEDISLIHPLTIITNVGHGHFFFTLTNTDDIGTFFDFRGEILVNGEVVAEGIKRCTTVQRNFPGTDIDIPVTLPDGVPVVSGDVIALRLSNRIGTNPDDTKCAGHRSAPLRFIYDGVGSPSQIELTKSPDPPTAYYLHSDGTTCTNTTITESQNVTNRFLSTLAPTSAAPKCKHSFLDFLIPAGNVWVYLGTWSLAPLP